MFYKFEKTDSLEVFRQAGLLTGPYAESNRLIVEHYPDNNLLISAMREVNKLDLATAEIVRVNFYLLSTHKHLSWVIQALQGLSVVANTNLRRKILSRHENLADLSLNLVIAYDLGLLTNDDHFSLICAHEDQASLFYILNKILLLNNSGAAIFKDEYQRINFCQSITILASSRVVMALEKLHPTMLTEEIFNCILNIELDDSGAHQQIIAILDSLDPDINIEENNESALSPTPVLTLSNSLIFNGKFGRRFRSYEEFKSWLRVMLGINVQKIASDGNCQFSAIKQQLLQMYPGGFPSKLRDILGDYGSSQVLTHRLRTLAVNYLKLHKVDFECFITHEDFPIHWPGRISFQSYVEHMSNDGSYGTEHTLRALSNILELPILILHPDVALNTTHMENRIYLPSNKSLSDFDLKQQLLVVIFTGMRHYDMPDDRPTERLIQLINSHMSLSHESSDGLVLV